MQQAIELAKESVKNGGGPFGAVIVCQDEVIASGANCVTLNNDPTAHAEVMAIREACQKKKTFRLENCDIYTSCEPCPMCLSAIYWSGIRRIYYAATRKDAGKIGFDDDFIYEQIDVLPELRTVPSVQMMREEAMAAFKLWNDKEDKVKY